MPGFFPLARRSPQDLIGEKLAHRLPLAAIRWVAAGVFILTGAWTLHGA